MKDFNGHRDQKLGHVTYAQNGDDLMLLNLVKLLDLGKLKTPYLWLDLGAHHPTNISNTRLLYERGDIGVNVEANPRLMDAFKIERPADLNINIGIGLKNGVDKFFMYSDTSGRNSFSVEEVESCKRLHNMKVREEIKLPISTLTGLVLYDLGGKWPPILLTDIEGLDYDVLASTEFGEKGPIVVVSEIRDTHSGRAADMMDCKGFSVYCRMGENLFFIRHDYVARAY